MWSHVSIMPDTRPKGSTCIDKETHYQVCRREFTKRKTYYIYVNMQGMEVRKGALENIVTDYVSIGDYLTGGELPAMVVIDSVSRLVPGVLNVKSAQTKKSFPDGLLEYPQYTRPGRGL